MTCPNCKSSNCPGIPKCRCAACKKAAKIATNKTQKSFSRVDISKVQEEVYLRCEVLNKSLALTKERAIHIHPEVKIHQDEFYETLKSGEPLKKETGEIVLFKWFKSVLRGKYMVVIVIDRDSKRPFIVTAMVTRKPPKGVRYEIKA